MIGDELFKFTADDGVADGNFGTSVAIDSGVAIVGDYLNNARGGDSGAAYLFDIATGSQLRKLTASDGRAGDLFGTSVAIDNGVAIVGSRWDDDAGSRSGSAYLFDVATGGQLFKLTADDAAAGDRFGVSVAIDNGVAIVGSYVDEDAGPSSGSAYLFDVASGTQLAKLTANDAAEFDFFGISVDIDDDVAIVGSYQDDVEGVTAMGSAYLFDVATGTQLRKLTASDGARSDSFGVSVAIDDGIAIVGSYLDTTTRSEAGSAYLFDVATGTQVAKLTATDAERDDRLGWSVAIDGSAAIVGGFGSNAAYLFDIETHQQFATLSSADAGAGDRFGLAVSISSDVATVGAPNGNAAYLFDAAFPAIFAPGDFNADGRVDNDDLNLLLGSWGQNTVPTEWVNGFVGPTVDNEELGGLLSGWGIGVSASIPEPHAVWLLGLSTAACGGRWRSSAFASRLVVRE